MPGIRKRPDQLRRKAGAVIFIQVRQALELVAVFVVIAGEGDLFIRRPAGGRSNAARWAFHQEGN